MKKPGKCMLATQCWPAGHSPSAPRPLQNAVVEHWLWQLTTTLMFGPALVQQTPPAQSCGLPHSSATSVESAHVLPMPSQAPSLVLVLKQQKSFFPQVAPGLLRVGHRRGLAGPPEPCPESGACVVASSVPRDPPESEPRPASG
jgi:hypothetical protein